MSMPPDQDCDVTLSRAEAAPDWRNLYGRRAGKTLRPKQKTYLAEDLAALSPGPVSRADNPGRAPLDLSGRFGARPIWLEIGFGGGEHMVHQAALHSEVAVIGCEPFINGVAMLLGKIRDAGVSNVAVHPGDVRDLFDVLPAASVSRAFLLYPDPWPKRRHHRRRFVNAPALAGLARVMAPGADLRLASDIPDYIRQALREVPAAGFALEQRSLKPWPDWTRTRYEAKALREGRTPEYLTFRRL
jgi:tRNA (guanine-N7-)-methyltransferase